MQLGVLEERCEAAAGLMQGTYTYALADAARRGAEWTKLNKQLCRFLLRCMDAADKPAAAALRKDVLQMMKTGQMPMHALTRSPQQLPARRAAAAD